MTPVIRDRVRIVLGVLYLTYTAMDCICTCILLPTINIHEAKPYRAMTDDPFSRRDGQLYRARRADQFSRRAAQTAVDAAVLGLSSTTMHGATNRWCLTCQQLRVAPAAALVCSTHVCHVSPQIDPRSLAVYAIPALHRPSLLALPAECRIRAVRTW
jgi:hypothetical protein